MIAFIVGILGGVVSFVLVRRARRVTAPTQYAAPSAESEVARLQALLASTEGRLHRAAEERDRLKDEVELLGKHIASLYEAA